MNQLTLLAVQLIVVPVLKGVATLAIKGLKKAPNGIPKKLALTMLDAIVENKANPVEGAHVEAGRATLSRE